MSSKLFVHNIELLFAILVCNVCLDIINLQISTWIFALIFGDLFFVYVQMSSDSDSDDDNHYDMKKRMVCHHAKKMSIVCSGATNIVGKYCKNWVMKADPRTSILSGFG